MEELIKTIRRRLTEYRYTDIDKEVGNGVSIHVNALDISISLVYYALLKKRAIGKNEEGWFEADLMLTYIFENSEWEDLHLMYRELCEQVKNRNYFRDAS